MTVQELLEKTTSHELTEWIAQLNIKNQEEKAAYDRQKMLMNQKRGIRG